MAFYIIDNGNSFNILKRFRTNSRISSGSNYILILTELYFLFGIIFYKENYLKNSSTGTDNILDKPYSSISVTVRLWSSMREIEPRQM